MAKVKKFAPGDLVRETADFLRNTGRVSTRRIDGVVVGGNDEHDMVYVVWSDAKNGEIPRRINAYNIEKKKTDKEPGFLLNQARIATGLPIGKFMADGHKVYVKTGNKWELFANYGTSSWKKDVDLVYDNQGKDVVVLSPDDSFVEMALDKEYSRAYQEAHPEMFKRGNPKAKKKASKKGSTVTTVQTTKTTTTRRSNPKRYGHHGRYLTGTVTDRGLRITPTAEGREEAQDAVESSRTHPRFWDMFEDWIGNGWMWIPPESIGALTDAPIISPNAYMTDDGEIVFDGEPVLYWHERYQVEDPVAEWANGSSVAFDLARSDNPPRMPKRGKHKVSRRPKAKKASKTRTTNPRERRLAKRLAQGGE